MIHAREDYNRFQDPALENRELLPEGATPIAEDEPVILFRAQDTYFLKVLQFYYHCLVTARNPQEDMLEAIVNHYNRAKLWQYTHTTKYPDMHTPSDEPDKLVYKGGVWEPAE